MITITQLNKILQNPDELREVSYQTLQQLLEQYPYCAGLSILLAKKQKEEESPVYQQSLISASMYANDRGKLYEFLNAKTLANKNTIKEGEDEESSDDQKKNNRVVELVPPPPVFYQQVSINPPSLFIEKKPPEIEKLTIVTEPEEEKVIETIVPKTIVEATTEIEEVEIEDWLRSIEPARIEENEQVATVKKNFKLPRIPVFEANLLNFLDEEEVAETTISKKKKGKKKPSSKKKTTPKRLPEEKEVNKAVDEKEIQSSEIPVIERPKEDNFSLFLSQTQGFLQSLQAKDMREEPAEKLDWEDDSTDEKEGVISETLADLLALQGQKAKAIKMYEALSLKFPKKNRLFADKIAQLK
jgi:hypothetical protein